MTAEGPLCPSLQCFWNCSVGPAFHQLYSATKDTYSRVFRGNHYCGVCPVVNKRMFELKSYFTEAVHPFTPQNAHPSIKAALKGQSLHSLPCSHGFSLPSPAVLLSRRPLSFSPGCGCVCLKVRRKWGLQRGKEGLQIVLFGFCYDPRYPVAYPPSILFLKMEYMKFLMKEGPENLNI